MSDQERLKKVKELWETAAAWNSRVAIWDSADVRDPETAEAAFDEAGRFDARRMAGFVAPGGHVLDLGCGIGRVLRYLSPHCEKLYGVDISSTMLDQAREYLQGVENVTLIETSGSKLPGVADASLDFLFSLLVLIHVDRRSAYRYFQEFARTLKPGGLALLQFHDILAAESLPKFLEVVDSDYPLEFYTLEELRYLLGTVGLQIVNAYPAAEYQFVTVVNGDAERWLEEQRDGLEARFEADTGCLAAQGPVRVEPGSVRLVLKNKLARPTTWNAFAGMTPREASSPRDFWFRVHAPIACAPGAETVVDVAFDPGQGKGSVSIDGTETPFAAWEVGEAQTAGPYFRNVGLIPPGFELTAETQARFPSCFSSDAIG